ncbi:MAG TPA: hypothetical protein VN706_05520 [Gemmatimonadaceae bacterium]|nr:hypothetical protein [Gemmatimonadaceae bacterium]
MTAPDGERAPSALQESGDAADANFSSESPDHPVLPCEKKTWVDVALVDVDGNPIANEPFKLTLPDGTVITGTTDENGMTGMDQIIGVEGQIEFTNLPEGAGEIVQ